MMRWTVPLVVITLTRVVLAENVTLKIQLPDGAKVASAAAIPAGSKTEVQGKIGDGKVTFPNLLAGQTYDVRLTMADGTTAQGVDMDWYNDDDAKENAGAVTDDDRQQIQAILDVPSFYNKNDVLALQGDHDRATGLVRLVRDKDFYAGKGEIVWRVELWYFKNQHGGWEKVQQQNKILRRERFKNREAYESATQKIKWCGALGGLLLEAGQPERIVKVEKF